ncbi:SIS domain-containing protein [Gordonia sp. TBRC 11910]|uniref:SIS domain-containing protein n=1 Tax=Gordonia asplenii TaxID=2725283 RepID=A0A848KLW6_9ACTN|nr:SIS domain-containing protein [Gordonia asplenii]NMN99655.1 SIS domain-containing protein [Gordonia asplenii]
MSIGERDSRAAILDAARLRIEAEAQAVAAVAESLTGFVDAVALITAASGKVVTVGVGTSGPIAARLAHLLSTTGTPAMYLHPGDALHGGLGAVTSGEVVLAVSKGGNSAELNSFVSLAKSRGAQILAVTASPEAALARQSDVVAVIPQTDLADPGGIAAMGSSIAVAAWGDALATVLMQISGYSWSQVLAAHPSGAVGEKSELPAALPTLSDPA